MKIGSVQGNIFFDIRIKELNYIQEPIRLFNGISGLISPECDHLLPRHQVRKAFLIRATSRGAISDASAYLPQSRMEALTLSSISSPALFDANGGELKDIVTLKVVPAPSQTHLVVRVHVPPGL